MTDAEWNALKIGDLVRSKAKNDGAVHVVKQTSLPRKGATLQKVFTEYAQLGGPPSAWEKVENDDHYSVRSGR